LTLSHATQPHIDHRRIDFKTSLPVCDYILFYQALLRNHDALADNFFQRISRPSLILTSPIRSLYFDSRVPFKDNLLKNEIQEANARMPAGLTSWWDNMDGDSLRFRIFKQVIKYHAGRAIENGAS
jgi:hypothetical protein